MLRELPAGSVTITDLKRINDFRYDSRSGVVLGLESYRLQDKFLMTSDGVNTSWYSFQHDHDVEQIMKQYNAGNLVSVKCFVKS